MKYNRLGRAGMRVSELSLGSWLTFGSRLDPREARACMRAAFDHGVNTFDTAESYENGAAESVMGLALKDFRREDVVVSTKIFDGGTGPNDTGLSRKHLIEGTKASLERLRLDYVDVLFCHRPDPATPIEETVRAIDQLIREGCAFYWGTSEWSAEQIDSAHRAAAECNASPPVVEQTAYNMFQRARVEDEYAPLYERHGMGLTTYSPLASGILSGKYDTGIPPGSRLDRFDWLRDSRTPERIGAVERLSVIASELSCSTAQLAIAWCLLNPNVSTVITGASSIEQVRENMGAVAIHERLTPELVEEIRCALENVG